MQSYALQSMRIAAIGAVSSLILCGNALAMTPGGDSLAPYEETGPFNTTTQAGGLSCTIYRPASLQDDHPVILWGNGTGGTPSTYGDGLEHWASWGFVVAAANTSNAGSGEEMLDCLDYLENASYSNQLDFSNVGASGHSQGGGGTIMAARDARITATAPVQPYILGLGHETSSQYQQTAPMLLLSGSDDTLAGPTLNQQPVYLRVDVPVFWATLDGAGHFEPVGDFGDFRGLTTAWWLYQLTGDADAADLFTGPCVVCDLSDWDVESKGL
ncbi:alpha/beta hydrolase [Marinobacter sp. JSM 1782161]|uniref:poly(ethylene terephthalate) hydrolase family protein n=1 Tax=Marinobacter sp. JSM 1782161 TaxID=2685906 RepID=UPI001D183419|nr:alpha/beta hydrolase [Marinobacter sp. JSM 1782161]